MFGSTVASRNAWAKRAVVVAGFGAGLWTLGALGHGASAEAATTAPPPAATFAHQLHHASEVADGTTPAAVTSILRSTDGTERRVGIDPAQTTGAVSPKVAPAPLKQVIANVATTSDTLVLPAVNLVTHTANGGTDGLADVPLGLGGVAGSAINPVLAGVPASVRPTDSPVATILVLATSDRSKQSVHAPVIRPITGHGSYVAPGDPGDSPSSAGIRGSDRGTHSVFRAAAEDDSDVTPGIPGWPSTPTGPDAVAQGAASFTGNETSRNPTGALLASHSINPLCQRAPAMPPRADFATLERATSPAVSPD
ncbi:MAG: hypothetical protein JWN95_3698 [Frankiales bacterium]|nr:hypothetical protein [Frankiales bacterium]